MRTTTVSASSSCEDTQNKNMLRNAHTQAMHIKTHSVRVAAVKSPKMTYHTSPVLPNHNSHGGVCSKDNHLDDDYALGRLCNI